MRRRPVILLLTLVVIMMSGLIALALLLPSSGRDVIPQHTMPSATASITVGVILTGPADQSGWDGLSTDPEGYATTFLDTHRVILLDNFNVKQRPGLTLETAVAGLLERGASAVFVAPYASRPDEIRIEDQYPGTVFIRNLSTRSDIEVLLAGLALTGSETSPTMPPVEHARPSSQSAAARRQSGSDILPVCVTALVIVLGGMMVLASNALRRSVSGNKTKSKRTVRKDTGLHHRRLALQDAARSHMTVFGPDESRGLLVHKLTTYVQGDGRYDESFRIETPDRSGYFGECGAGVTAPVDPYHPDKVAALEVWLFDKEDVRTRTAVLAAGHACQDAPTQARFKRKGAVIPAEVGAAVELETRMLRLRARVIDLLYGYDPSLPANSFFEHIVIEIAVWQKNA